MASIYSHVPYDQTPSVLVVGERTNANGSKKFREAMLADDWDTCVAMAREAIKGGSHVLDVCVDYTGEDGVADMREVASRFATQATLPIMLDSTEPPVIEAGLQLIAGKPILNSVNLEDGDAPGTRLDRFLSMAREYGAAVVCTCIDTDGQARTAEWKLRAARAIHDLAVDRYGLAPEDLLFDPLVLPISTGMEESRRDGIETIEGIRRIKAELPGVGTLVGLSNVSFGLNPSARHALNSVFLHECQEAGLDAAIVHAARIMPLHKIDPRRGRGVPRSDLRPPGRRPQATTRWPSCSGSSMGWPPPSLVTEDRSDWPVERRLSQRIIDGDRDGLEADLDSALAGPVGRARRRQRSAARRDEGGRRPVRFRPDAAAVRAAIGGDHEGGGGPPGTAHGKGGRRRQGPHRARHRQGRRPRHRQEPGGHHLHQQRLRGPQPRDQGAARRLLDAARDMGADAIGMSGLLVKSTLIMRENLLEMNDRGLSSIPVILGGAALTRTYVERDLRSEYQGRLFYGKDAFEGLHTMDRLMELKRSGVDDPDFGRVAAKAARAPDPGPPGRPQPELTAPTSRSTRTGPPGRPRWPADNPVFAPPFLGTRIERGIPLDDIAAYLNETSLFRRPMGLPARQVPPGDRRRVQGPHPGRAAGPAGRGPDRRGAPARGGVRLFRGQLRGRRPDRVEGRNPHLGVAALHLPPPGRRPVAVDRRLLPVRRHPARPTTPPSTWSPWAPGRPKKRPVFSRRTAIRTTSTSTASEWR